MHDCVLFACNEKDDYYYSIGEGVHHEIDHLAVIHENFFDKNAGSLKEMN